MLPVQFRKKLIVKKVGSFPFVPPRLLCAYYLQPPDACAIFLHNDLLCKDTCSVTEGSITYWGAQTENIQKVLSSCSDDIIEKLKA